MSSTIDINIDNETSNNLSINNKIQYLLDKSSPYVLYRWIFYILLLILYLYRIYICDGFYVITYAYGIYLLNQFIGFLTPQFDPEDNEDLSLPTSNNDEYRPFARRLPEFKFWLSYVISTIISLLCTFFKIFDIPVFWPILVMYFIILFIFTMKKQILHMIKYKYIPFDFGKTVYPNAGQINNNSINNVINNESINNIKNNN